VQVYTTREFARFARKQRITEAQLCAAIERVERGLLDADLGGGLIKQRVARPGQGRSGGYRTIIAHRTRTRSIFMYGFAKNTKANLSDEELTVYRRLAVVFLKTPADGLAAMVAEGELNEVDCDV
jgi:hypothetical protein